MKVLFVCRVLCARALGSLIRLEQNGFEVTVAYSKSNQHIFNASNVEYFDGTQPDLIRVVNEVKPVIVHVHNTPDRPTMWIRQFFNGCICHDVHDFSADPGMLKICCRVADYVYCVNDDMAKSLSHSISNRPVQTYHTVPPRERGKAKKLSDIDGKTHVVFIGGFHHADNAERDCEILSKWFEDIGVKLHVHCHTFRETVKKYENEFFQLEDVINYFDIPERLSVYDAGMCLPFDGKKEHLVFNYTYMLPSKLFDYLQAGIPVICDQKYLTMSDYIARHGLGKTYETFDISVVDSAVKMKVTDYPYKTILDVEPYKRLIKTRRKKNE